jgi:hypothetical protein
MSPEACTSLRTRLLAWCDLVGSSSSSSIGLVSMLFFGSFLLLITLFPYDHLRLRRNIEYGYSID